MFIDRIVLTPNAANSSLQIDLHGDLAGILSVAESVQRTEKAVSGEGTAIKMVEGTSHTFKSHARPQVAAMKLVGPAGTTTREIFSEVSRLRGSGTSYTNRNTNSRQVRAVRMLVWRSGVPPACWEKSSRVEGRFRPLADS